MSETVSITSSASEDKDSEEQMNLYNLFVKNNSQNVQNEQIKELFESKIGQVQKIVMTKNDNFFVYFTKWNKNEFTLKLQKHILLNETFFIKDSNLDFECQHIVPQKKKDANEILSIFIQNTKNIAKIDIKNALEKDYGTVRKIDMKKDKKGIPCTFVHFSNWYDTTFSNFVQTGLENNQSFTLTLPTKDNNENFLTVKFYRNFSKSNISSPKNNPQFTPSFSPNYPTAPMLSNVPYTPPSPTAMSYNSFHSPQSMNRVNMSTHPTSITPIQTSFSTNNLTNNDATLLTRHVYANQQKHKLFLALRDTNESLKNIVKENNKILMECQFL